MSDETTSARRQVNGRFLEGVAGPGRRKGARNKLGEQFVQALQQDFEAHGADTIAKVREERPHEYLKVLASILPKELNVKVNALGELSDEEIAEGIAALQSMIAAQTDRDEAGEEGAETSSTSPAHSVEQELLH